MILQPFICNYLGSLLHIRDASSLFKVFNIYINGFQYRWIYFPSLGLLYFEKHLYGIKARWLMDSNLSSSFFSLLIFQSHIPTMTITRLSKWRLLVPFHLNFLMFNMKNVFNISLNAENHLTWRFQVLKLFKTNYFDGCFDGSLTCLINFFFCDNSLPKLNLHSTLLLLMDQNLATTWVYLFSSLSPLLFYLIFST